MMYLAYKLNKCSRSGAAAERSYLASEVRGGSWEKTPHVRGQGRQPRGATRVQVQGRPGGDTSHPRPRAVTLRSHPEPKARGDSWEEPPTPKARAGGWEEHPEEWWLRRCRRA